jgi:hypothetical protein
MQASDARCKLAAPPEICPKHRNRIFQVFLCDVSNRWQAFRRCGRRHSRDRSWTEVKPTRCRRMVSTNGSHCSHLSPLNQRVCILPIHICMEMRVRGWSSARVLHLTLGDRSVEINCHAHRLIGIQSPHRSNHVKRDHLLLKVRAKPQAQEFSHSFGSVTRECKRSFHCDHRLSIHHRLQESLANRIISPQFPAFSSSQATATARLPPWASPSSRWRTPRHRSTSFVAYTALVRCGHL